MLLLGFRKKIDCLGGSALLGIILMCRLTGGFRDGLFFGGRLVRTGGVMAAFLGYRQY